MPRYEYVRIKDCTIGNDTIGGGAVWVEIDGSDYAVPYSQIQSLTRSPHKQADELKVARWLAEKEGWEYEEV